MKDLSKKCFCPDCGTEQLTREGIKRWHCAGCGFVFYFNVAAAVAAVLRWQDQVLLTLRKNEPGQGKLDLPGGFVDPGETLEQALARELEEELHLKVSQCQYLFSYANTYAFKGLVYPTTDAFFELTFKHKPLLQAADDVAAFQWVPISAIDINDIAFDSIKMALRRLEVSRHQ